jgi:hypothetical protein
MRTIDIMDAIEAELRRQSGVLSLHVEKKEWVWMYIVGDVDIYAIARAIENKLDKK